MARKLMGHEVPEEMFRMANGILARGGKAYVCLPEGRGEGSCDNCKGWGHFILQHVTGGPFSGAPRSGKDGSAAFINGDWYVVRNDQFNCPECLGTGTRRRPVREEKQPIHF